MRRAAWRRQRSCWPRPRCSCQAWLPARRGLRRWSCSCSCRCRRRAQGKTFSPSTRVRWLAMLLAPERMASRRVWPVIMVSLHLVFADTILLVGNDVVHIHIDAGDFQAGGKFNFVSLTRWVMLWVMVEMFRPNPTLMCRAMTNLPPLLRDSDALRRQAARCAGRCAQRFRPGPDPWRQCRSTAWRPASTRPEK